MGCGDPLVIEGPEGEPEVICGRQKCRRTGTTTPIRPLGFLRVPEGLGADRAEEILAAIAEGLIPAEAIDQYLDPPAAYRQIEGLIVIGPKEWEQAMLSSNGDDPLGLNKGWCPRLPLPPTWTPEKMRQVVELCQTPEWNCVPVLELELCEIAGQPITFKKMYEWWGVAHDGLGPGAVRGDIIWSNWGIKDGREFVDQPVDMADRWVLKFMDFPAFSAKLPWDYQRKELEKRGLAVSGVASDMLTMSLCAIHGHKFRLATWARTNTTCKSRPLGVCWSEGYGVYVSQHFNPENALEPLGAAAEGVPLELGF